MLEKIMEAFAKERSENARNRFFGEKRVDAPQKLDREGFDGAIKVAAEKAFAKNGIAATVDAASGRGGFEITVDGVRAANAYVGTDQAYGAYVEGVPLKRLEDDFVELAVTTARALAEKESSLGRLSGWNEAKTRLVMTLGPAGSRRDPAPKEPRFFAGDMAIGYAVDFSDVAEGATCPVTYAMLKAYGVDDDELREAAETSAPRLRPATLKRVGAIVDPSGVGKQAEIYAAAAHGVPDGAVAIFYPGFLKEAAKKIGGRLFVFPGITDAAILVRDDGRWDADRLREAIAQSSFANADMQGVLTSSAYTYDDETETFARVV